MKIKLLKAYLGTRRLGEDPRRPMGDRLSTNIPFTDGKKLRDKVGTFLPMRLD
jgi:hypothetical protein